MPSYFLQYLALGLFCLFYGSYFIKAFTQKWRGIRTDRMGLGDKPSYTRRVEFFLKAATLILALLQVLGIFLFKLAANLQALIGLVTAFLGCLMLILAMIHMRQSWRAGVDLKESTTLVTSGIYRFSRNPAFTGFDLFYTGFSLLLPHPILIAVSLIVIILFHLQILEEEKSLPKIFGAEYTRYKQKVRRYF